MARDIEKEQERIRTGNRYVVEVGQSTGVFPRDIDFLYVQYTNLRNKIYSQHSVNFTSHATKAELRSYIDEEFIKLCKEYEINGEVDFPYYIKTKLNARVDGTFKRRTLRQQGREPLGTTEAEVESMLDTEVGERYNDEGYHDLVTQVIEGVHLSEVETAILVRLLEGNWKHKQIHREIGKPHGLTLTETTDTIHQIQQLVAIKLGYHR